MKRVLKAAFLVVLAYLIQGSIMPYLKIFGKSPNLLMSVIAITSVAYTPVMAFGVAALTGILKETLMPTIPGMEVIIYPALGFLATVLFGDKSERKLEQEIAAGKKGQNLPAHLRTLFSVAFLMVIYEIVYLIYVYLAEGLLPVNMVFGALWSVVYTLLLTLVMMLPIRYVLGMYSAFKEKRKMRKKEKKQGILRSDKV